jgi:hypothetical protein
MMNKKVRYSNLALLLALAGAILYAVYLQFLSPAFYEPDSYYHIAVANFIKQFGLHHKFPWAQFSTFKFAFADKEVLFHILTVPFLFLTDNLVLAGKYAFIFHIALFFLVYAFILKKYIPDFLAAVFLLLLFSSLTFSSYLLQFRSITLANILSILCIYFLINKNRWGVFVISLLYPLAHVSFFLVILLAFACEILRWHLRQEFFAKNIYLASAGVVLGCLLHPNFPNNLFSLYLNGLVVPLYEFTGTDLGFADELWSLSTKLTIINNFTVFLGFGFILWASLLTKRRVGFSTCVWLFATSTYILLGFFGNRYWYQANILFYIFFASYLKDWTENKGWIERLLKFKAPIAFCLAAILAVSLYNFKQLKESIRFGSERSLHFENVGRWMQKNIPANQTIYHSYWGDSPYFICLNPKDYYINVLDPIYMFYRYPREFNLLNEVSLGRVDKPYEALGKIFRTNYGYVNKFEPLYRQVREYPRQFKILYEDNEGIVFGLMQ